FNGTVLVEWFNTSLGIDLDGVWIATREELLREGYAWVGVSAEPASIDALKDAHPARYARARIGSDDRSFDIFTHAARLVRGLAPNWGTGNNPPQLLGTGYSQSGSFLYTYINTFQARSKAFDGYYLHGAAWAAIPLNRWDINTYYFRIRADLDVPVMIVQSEAEIQFSKEASKTADSDRLRYWEVAATAHFGQGMQEGARALEGL